MYKCIYAQLQWAKIHWKNPLGKWFFQILAKLEMTQNKSPLSGDHFETVQHFWFFFRIVIVYSVYIYGVNFIAKFRWESGFLRLSPWDPPWALTGLKVPWSLKC